MGVDAVAHLDLPARRAGLAAHATDEPGATACMLFLGTLEPRKNVGMLLDAYERLLARLPRAPPLVLAGRAAPDAEPLVDARRRAPLAGHVELPGYVDDGRRSARSSTARSCSCCRRTLEGFGLPALEAMTVGVPVVAANRGALPERSAPAGRLVDPDDAGRARRGARRRALDDRAIAAGACASRLGARAARSPGTPRPTRMREAWALAVEHRRARHG